MTKLVFGAKYHGPSSWSLQNRVGLILEIPAGIYVGFKFVRVHVIQSLDADKKRNRRTAPVRLSVLQRFTDILFLGIVHKKKKICKAK